MAARRTTAIAATAAVALLAAGAAATAVQSSGRPRGVVATCSTRSQAAFSGAFGDPRNLVVGPLVLVGAGGVASWGSVSHGNKFPLLVRNGHRVTIELSRKTRKGAGLAYGPLPEGLLHLRDTHRVVTFVACGRGRDSGSTAGGRPVTFWSGGVLAASPRCVPLLVWIDGADSPRRAYVRFETQHC
jgi:hypothetical protein